MKRRYPALILTMLLATVGVYGAGRNRNITEVKIQTLDLREPEYVYAKQGSAPLPEIRTGTGEWLVLQVNYCPRNEKNQAPIPEKKSGKVVAVNFPGYMNEVTVSARLLVESGITDGGKPVFILITGKVVLETVALDGGRHTVLMFVHPRMLDKYTSAWRTNSKGKRACKVEVVISCNDEELAREYCNMTGARKEWRNEFENLCKEVPGSLILQGALLPKSKSPWRDYRPSCFDLEKAEIR